MLGSVKSFSKLLITREITSEAGYSDRLLVQFFYAVFCAPGVLGRRGPAYRLNNKQIRLHCDAKVIKK